MAETCVSFTGWMPYALLAALAAGVGMGTFIRLGIDRAELATYRRFAQRHPTTIATEEALDRIMDRARRIAGATDG